MPKPSMTRSLSAEQKTQLDQFVEENYDKLRTYAFHQTKDDEKADELLHELVMDLYTGRKVLKFGAGQSPLTYCQHLMRNVRSRDQSSRKKAFEEGFLVNTKDGVTTSTNVRDILPDEDSSKHPYEAFDTLLLDRGTRYDAYLAIKPSFRPRHQWILMKMEDDIPTKDIYIEYGWKFGSPMSWNSFKIEVSHLLQKVRTRIEAHLQVAG
jgi:DNA-directed RNA polymerase specialized sigma24 family protein